MTVREQGAAAPGGAKYTASKTLAERAAWDFVEKEKAAIGWDLVTLCPPFIFGPFLHEVAKPELLNTSAQLWYFMVVKGTFDNETLANGGYALEETDSIGTHHLVSVTLGLFDDADGLVQVSGAGVAAGQKIVVPNT